LNRPARGVNSTGQARIERFLLWGLCERGLYSTAEGEAVSGITFVLIVLRLVCLEAVVWFVVMAFLEIIRKITDPRIKAAHEPLPTTRLM